MPDDVEQLYPARHYVMVNDKLDILAALKMIRRNRLATAFPRQGHYAVDPNNTASSAPADITVERSGDLSAAIYPLCSAPLKLVAHN